MKQVQEKLNSLYGSEIKSIEFLFRSNEIHISVVIKDKGEVENFDLKFIEVIGHELRKEWADEEWLIISIAEIFYLPELGTNTSVSEDYKSKYNFLIDGDGFDLYIAAKQLIIEDEEIML